MVLQLQAVRDEDHHGHKTRRKSAVWDYFDYDVATAMATCKRCGSPLTADSGNGTSHLWRHVNSSICATRAAERAAPCLPGLEASPAGDGDGDGDEEEWWAEWKWIDEVQIDPDLFLMDDQLDSGAATDSLPFTDGGGEVAVARDHEPRSPNSMPDTPRMSQATSSSSTRFFRKKRDRSVYLASRQDQGGTTDKDHSSPVNTDWATTVDNSVV